MRDIEGSHKLCSAMIIRMRSLLVSGLLLLTSGFTAATHAQTGPAHGGPPGGPGRMGPSAAGREFGPPSFRSPNQAWPPVSNPGSRPPAPMPPTDTESGEIRSVPLSDVVSQVQQQFNATAVKADTVREDGQLVYRIRLLSADKARIWTVSVDAQTGQLR